MKPFEYKTCTIAGSSALCKPIISIIQKRSICGLPRQWMRVSLVRTLDALCEPIINHSIVWRELWPTSPIHTHTHTCAPRAKNTQKTHKKTHAKDLQENDSSLRNMVITMWIFTFNRFRNKKRKKHPFRFHFHLNQCNVIAKRQFRVGGV